MTKSKQPVKHSYQSGLTADIGKGRVGPLEAISPELAFMERFNDYVSKTTTRRVSWKRCVPKLSNKVLPREIQ